MCIHTHLPARVTNVHAAMTVCSCCIPVAPSPPICNIVGKTEYFENIELTCRSEEGTPTPAYKWQSYNVNNNARQLPLKATDGTCVCDAAQIHAERYGVKSMPHILANESIENKINVLFANKNKELKMKYYEKMHFANKNKEYNFSPLVAPLVSAHSLSGIVLTWGGGDHYRMLTLDWNTK